MASMMTFTEKGVKEFQYRSGKKLESRCHQGQQCTTSTVEHKLQCYQDGTVIPALRCHLDDTVASALCKMQWLVPIIIVQNLVVLGQPLWAYIGVQKFGGLNPATV